MTTRSNLVDALTPLLPKRWKFVDNPRNLDTLSVPSVIVNLVSFRRTPEAPQGARTVSFLVTLVEPNQDIAKGSDLLDDDVELLLTAIEKQKKQISWNSATRVKWGDQYPNAYDIDLTVITPKE
jgi:hypothetical protein